MRVRRGLPTGIIACLLLFPILLVFAVSSIQADAEPFMVPVGNVGDRVAYSGFLNTTITMSNAPVTTSQPFRTAFEVERLAVTADRWSNPHDTVIVTETSELAGPIPVFDVVEAAVQSYVDLGTRDVVRMNQVHSAVGSLATFGPIARNGILGANMSLFAHQGRTYEVGASLFDRQSFLTDCALQRGQGRERVSGSSYAVVREGLVEGERAVELLLSRTYTRVDANGTELHGTLVERTWLAAGTPYPVRVESVTEERAGNRLIVRNETKWLISRTPGSTPIPFEPDNEPTCPPGASGSLERSGPDAQFPAMGTGSTFPYPIEQAMQNLENDPSLATFRAWRSARSPVALVGGTVYETREDATGAQPVDEWNLYFASADDLVMVQMMRRESQATSSNQLVHYQATDPMPRISPDALPHDPLTIGQMTRIFLSIAGDRWKNYDQFTFGHNGPVMGACDPHAPCTYPSGPWFYHDEHVGRVQTFETLSAARPVQATLDVNLTSGEVLFYREDYFEGVLTGPSNDQSVAPLLVAGSSSRAAPSFIVAAAATSSILALFLVAYFYPFLKFVGSRLLGFWPGYAKLRMDDVLGHQVRESVHELVKREPGITPPQIQSTLTLAWSTLVYHLGVLEKNKVVSSLLDGRHKRFFPVGEVDWSSRNAIAALRNPTTSRIFDAVQASPGINQAELAKLVGITPQAIGFHIDRLTKGNLIRREREGRNWRVFTAGASAELAQASTPGAT